MYICFTGLTTAIYFIACVNLVQVLYVGGLFPQFRRDSENKFVIDEAGVRRMTAAQLAIDKVNDKSDGVYDDLLPHTQVCYILV